jgi:hypothetical protein
MQNYQIYPLDEHGLAVQPPAIIFCDTDTEAIGQAEALAAGQAVELRAGDRIVLRIDGESPQREQFDR